MLPRPIRCISFQLLAPDAAANDGADLCGSLEAMLEGWGYLAAVLVPLQETLGL